MTPASMQFENAGMNVTVLRHELLRAGLVKAANRLVGIEVQCRYTALGALEVVKCLNIREDAPKEVISSRDWTLIRLAAAAA